MQIEILAMTVCKEIKTFSRAHEHIADLFSVLALVLIFATVWSVLKYHQTLLEWWSRNIAVNSTILVGALVVDVFLVLGFLAVGSARFGDDDERCFGTFHGRRNHGKPFGAFRAWLNHMENVGKKHR
jgi:predicted Na+-dependent transporter